MSPQRRILLLVITLAVAASSQADTGGLNEWLGQHVPSGEPESSVQQAGEYFAIHKDEFNEREAIEWRRFIKLDKMSYKCDRETVDYLNSLRNTSNKNVRVIKVVEYYLREHSANCQRVYNAKFLLVYSEENSDLVKKIAASFERTLGPYPLGFELLWPGYVPFRDQFKRVRSSAEEAVRPLLEEGITLDEIYESCERYINKLEELFELAEFDAETEYEPQFGSKSLMRGWMNYEICRNFLKVNRDDLSNKLAA